MSREASERFAAGYIQCMHEVHTFVSTCPGIEATVAAELLNHLLEGLPLNEDLQHVIADLGSELLSPTGVWPRISSQEVQASALSPTSSTEEDTSFELEETFSETAPSSSHEEEKEKEEEEEEHRSTAAYCTSMWRPW
ncbi:Transcription cofactor HES-6 [Bagarius yarrelli]|uniref:Transcription cofactor HES-6 n=1 Tax=Bagarius yarrelli TaxID=175774 RepID=A0A556U6G2_BAGYA|nr:Transcription cofactor HES-6 [Bagarius yarrelli]